MVAPNRKGGARTDPAKMKTAARLQPPKFSNEAAPPANLPLAYSLGENKHDAQPQQHEAEDLAAFAAECLDEPSRSGTKGARYICGPLDVDIKNAKGNWRIAEAALPRRWLAVDIDGCPPDEFPALRTWAKQWRHFRYTTASDTPESRRVRFVFDLADEVDRAQGIAHGEWLTAEVATVAPGAKVDPSVFRAEQQVFLPLVGAKSFMWLDAPPMPVQAGASDTGDTSDAGDALMAMNATKVPNMTPEQALHVLNGLADTWGSSESGTWYKVAGALHLQFGGSEDAYEVLDEWSEPDHRS